MGNALHYTQIKKSDLKFEPFAEYLAEEGDWMDITIISDSPLLEHDAMYMLQHYDKARQRLLEIRARDQRGMITTSQSTADNENLGSKEENDSSPIDTKSSSDQKSSTIESKKSSKSKTQETNMMSFEEEEDEDDIF